jgi:hypothetical protein
MGIQGLLLALRPITCAVHVSDPEFKSKRCAIDASAWCVHTFSDCTLLIAFAIELYVYIFLQTVRDITVLSGSTGPPIRARASCVSTSQRPSI